MARSKNNPHSRNKEQVVTVHNCEFCGSTNGTHIVKLGGGGRKGRMAWVCNDDKCPRHG